MNDEQRKELLARCGVWRATATAHNQQREFFLATSKPDEAAFCNKAEQETIPVYFQ